jgi:hypothetical protein
MPTDSFSAERLQREKGIQPPSPTPPAAQDVGQILDARRPFDPLAGLSTWGQRRALPPRPTLERHASELLVAALDRVTAAEVEARQAADEASAALPGGLLWRAAIEADRYELAAAVHADRPLPRIDSSALLTHFTEVIPHLVSLGWRASILADLASEALQVAAMAEASSVSERCDLLGFQVEERWEQAKRSGRRGEYDAGRETAAAWSEAPALSRWCDQPHQPWRKPVGGFPSRLQFLEYEASLSCGGEERISPPLPATTTLALEREFGSR